jgi:hypothetical protein
MNGDQFETLLRSCSGVATRRRALAGLAALVAGGAIGVVESRNASATSAARGKRKGNACRKKRDGAACDNNGQCLNGKCNRRPACASAGTACGKGQFDCCSLRCVAILGQPDAFCAEGEANAKCRVDSDCQSGSCVGFRCQA